MTNFKLTPSRERCPICETFMDYANENLFGDKIFYCKTHGKIEVPKHENKP